MAHTDHSERTAQTARTVRRHLRREVAGVIGLLADAHDFAAMRPYTTFTFDDHDRYLRQFDALLRSRSAQGAHTTVALFDPEEFTEYCEDTGLDPDTVAARGQFTAGAAASGAAVPYSGQPLDTLVPLLIDTAVRRATWEYATALLADLGGCADCGQDIGAAAFQRASHLLLRLLEKAGPGTHHIVCSVPASGEQLLAAAHLHRPTGAAPVRADSSEATELVTVLAAGIALESPAGVVLRTTDPEAPDRLYGWRLAHGLLVPLTAGEVFNAYCTDADTGEPLSPESGVDYRAGFELGADDTGLHH